MTDQKIINALTNEMGLVDTINAFSYKEGYKAGIKRCLEIIMAIDRESLDKMAEYHGER